MSPIPVDLSDAQRVLVDSTISILPIPQCKTTFLRYTMEQIMLINPSIQIEIVRASDLDSTSDLLANNLGENSSLTDTLIVKEDSLNLTARFNIGRSIKLRGIPFFTGHTSTLIQNSDSGCLMLESLYMPGESTEEKCINFSQKVTSQTLVLGLERALILLGKRGSFRLECLLQHGVYVTEHGRIQEIDNIDHLHQISMSLQIDGDPSSVNFVLESINAASDSDLSAPQNARTKNYADRKLSNKTAYDNLTSKFSGTMIKQVIDCSDQRALEWVLETRQDWIMGLAVSLGISLVAYHSHLIVIGFCSSSVSWAIGRLESILFEFNYATVWIAQPSYDPSDLKSILDQKTSTVNVVLKAVQFANVEASIIRVSEYNPQEMTVIEFFGESSKIDSALQYMQVYAKRIVQIKHRLRTNDTIRDFVSGKKDGKLIKIMRDTGVSLALQPVPHGGSISKLLGIENSNFNKTSASKNNDYHDISRGDYLEVELVGENAYSISTALSMLLGEFPAELFFYLDESHHKRLIGHGGKTIQSVMKRFAVYVKFISSADPQPILGATLGHTDDFYIDVRPYNVIIRTPAKNKNALEASKATILRMAGEENQILIDAVLHLRYGFTPLSKTFSDLTENQNRIKNDSSKLLYLIKKFQSKNEIMFNFLHKSPLSEGESLESIKIMLSGTAHHVDIFLEHSNSLKNLILSSSINTVSQKQSTNYDDCEGSPKSGDSRFDKLDNFGITSTTFTAKDETYWIESTASSLVSEIIPPSPTLTLQSPDIFRSFPTTILHVSDAIMSPLFDGSDCTVHEATRRCSSQSSPNFFYMPDNNSNLSSPFIFRSRADSLCNSVPSSPHYQDAINTLNTLEPFDRIIKRSSSISRAPLSSPMNIDQPSFGDGAFMEWEQGSLCESPITRRTRKMPSSLRF